MCEKQEVGLECEFHRRSEHGKQVHRSPTPATKDLSPGTPVAQDDKSFIVNEINNPSSILTAANCRTKDESLHTAFPCFIVPMFLIADQHPLQIFHRNRFAKEVSLVDMASHVREQIALLFGFHALRDDRQM